MVRKFLTVFLATFCLLVPAMPAANAYNPFGTACNAGSGSAKQSATACSNSSVPLTGQNGIIKKVTNIISLIAGVTAVIIIMIGALQYVVSNGDSQKTANARMAIIGGVIGLAIIAAAQGIVLLVLSRLQS